MFVLASLPKKRRGCSHEESLDLGASLEGIYADDIALERLREFEGIGNHNKHFGSGHQSHTHTTL